MNDHFNEYDDSSNLAMFLSNICMMIILYCFIFNANINTALLFMIPTAFLWIIGFSTFGGKDENLNESLS